MFSIEEEKKCQNQSETVSARNVWALSPLLSEDSGFTAYWRSMGRSARATEGTAFYKYPRMPRDVSVAGYGDYLVHLFLKVTNVSPEVWKGKVGKEKESNA